jgi:hypothetical protein
VSRASVSPFYGTRVATPGGAAAPPPSFPTPAKIYQASSIFHKSLFCVSPNIHT